MSSLYNSSEVDILVNGKPVKKYTYRGRVFIEAKNGTEYTIRIKNNSILKRLAIAAVDGINVINGEAGGASDAGYLINGYNAYEIKGFRTSNDAVNVFKFADKQKSYAAKSEETGGDTSNCGVIGVQIFEEKIKPVIFPKITRYNTPINRDYHDFRWGGSLLRSCDNEMLCSSSYGASVNNMAISTDSSTVQGFDLGTEFSDKEISDKVTEVEFEKGYLESTFEIYYASRDALLAMGVPLEKETAVAFPKAFPAKFCKPPKK
jgi:hypothetical protein